ncbi:MAG: hypothetical protein ACTSO3_16135 [Candidatus Heimdallarchaeaceae archaeon]
MKQKTKELISVFIWSFWICISLFFLYLAVSNAGPFSAYHGSEWGCEGKSGTGSGGACTTPSTGDELNEGFLGAGYENTWTESGTSTILDEDVTLPSSPPTGCCSEGLKIDFVSGNDHTYWNKGSTIPYTTTTNIIFYVYFDTLGLTDDYEGTALVIWDDDTTHALWSHGTAVVEVVKNPASSTGYYIRGKANTISSGIEITTGTWYKVMLHLDANAESSYIQIDDGTQQSFTREDVNGQYLSLGVSELESGDSFKCYIGYIYIDTP